MIADESDGVHGRVCAAASLCFVLVPQARNLSLSAFLGWAEEAPKRHARNIDVDAVIIEVLNYPLAGSELNPNRPSGHGKEKKKKMTSYIVLKRPKNTFLYKVEKRPL